MLELLKQFEEDCAEDEHEIREGEAAAQLADRLQDVDLGKVTEHNVFHR